MKKMFLGALMLVMFVVPMVFLAGCGGNGGGTENGGATPTITLSRNSVSLTNSFPTASTITVGGTATGEITFDTSQLPTGVTATLTDWNTFSVTGVRPTEQGAYLYGTYILTVTRGGVSAELEIVINLTTTYVPTLILKPSSNPIVLCNINHIATVEVGGTAQGEITFTGSWIGVTVNVSVEGSTITLTGIRPYTNEGILGISVHREGVSEWLTFHIIP